MAIGAYISIITLNVDGLNAPTQRQTGWMDPKTGPILHSKGNYNRGKKTTLRRGENNSKWNNWQRINFQNIQASHTTQCQKKKQPNQIVGKRPKQTFLQRRHTGD